MRRYRVIVLKTARTELDNVIKYISTEFVNPVAAAKREKEIWDGILGLEYMPAGSKVKENLYCAHTKNYRIYYQIHNHDIVVTAIRHYLQQ